MREKSAADCKQKAGVIAPVVDLKRCEGKGDCVTVCPENVFEAGASTRLIISTSV